MIASFPGKQKTIFAGLLLLVLSLPAHAVKNITVDASQINFTRAKNATGFLTSGLTDFVNPNPATPYTNTISQSCVGWLRFMDGGMSKNYLWHTPGDYTNAVNGLKPQVASLSTPPGTAQYSGYRLANNSPVFNNIPMNFDQFIQVCQATGVEPIVAVSAEAYKYPNTAVTMGQLLTNAVEWVRYANVTRGYHVKYWQIGNEQDSNGGWLTTNQYVYVLTNFSAAMKAVDPSIKIGAGVSFDLSWMTYVLSNALNYIDFITPHSFGSTEVDTYATYRTNTETGLGTMNTTLLAILTAVPIRQQSQFEILVTAMNGGHDGNNNGTDNQTNVVYKGLANFEKMANILTDDPRIISADMWNIRNPFDADTPRVLTDVDAFDFDNNLTPVGCGVQVLAQFLKPTILNVTMVNGYLRSYAAWNTNDSTLAVWIVNKDTNADTANLTLTNFNQTGSFDKWVFTGDSPVSTNYTWQQVSSGLYSTNPLTVTLSPCSITVLHFNLQPTVNITSPLSGQSWSNVVFTATGTVTDKWPVASVQYQLNGGIWTNATGTTNWSAHLTLTPGTNTFAAYATDIIGVPSSTNSVNFQYVVTNKLQIRATGLGTLLPNYSNAWLNIGQNYSITSAPAMGFVFTNWTVSTNWTGGTTVTRTNLQFMMESNLTLLAIFNETSRPTLTITAPTNNQHMTNAIAYVTGTNSDNWGISNVWYRLNSNTWNYVTTTTNNLTNWTQTVTLLSGTNTVNAYAVNLGGIYSQTNSVSFVSSNTFALQLVFTNPQPLKTNGLVFTLDLSTGLNGHIQVSSNLINWGTLTNFIGSNATITFKDPGATNSGQRYYRAVIP